MVKLKFNINSTLIVISCVFLALSCTQPPSTPQSKTHQSSQIVRRAALDIGSALTKLQVADVDMKTNRIVNVVMTKLVNLGFSQDLAETGADAFSEGIQLQAIKILAELKKEADQHNPVSYQGVATAAFRKAKNNQQLTQRIEKEVGIRIRTIDQQEEGVLGFLTAIALTDADPENTITWDTGGGSFQLTGRCDGDYTVLLGDLGMASLHHTITHVIQKRESQAAQSPNPIHPKHAKETLDVISSKIGSVPSCLISKLKDPKTRVLDLHSPTLFPDNRLYSLADVAGLLKQRIGLSDEELREKPHLENADSRALAESVSYPLMVYAIMKQLDIPQASSVIAPGNMAGVLISEKYWK